MSRFTDDILTGSTANQRSIIRADNQPYPGDVARAAPAPIDNRYPAPVARAPEPAPVQRQALPPAAPAVPQVAARPAPRLDPSPTGTIAPAAPPAAAQPAEDVVYEGWSRAGGTRVALKQGETLNSLSRRFGVPVKAIMKVNGIASADSVAAGQSVIIPTYVQAARAPTNGRPVTDNRAPQPTDVPRPAQRPEAVAVLPQEQKVRQPQPPQNAGPVPSAQGGQGGIYTVVSGDSLNAVARKTGVRVDAIRQANGLKPDAGLRVGQKLTIPAGGNATVAAAPRVDPVVTGTPGPAKPVAAKPEPSQPATYTPPKRNDTAIQAAVEADDAKAPNGTGIGKMRWPVRGRVVGTYGNSGGSGINDGIDIAVPEGTPVKAAENGVVIFAGEGLKDFGKTVLVRHADGKVTVYGHTSQINVNRGDTVRRGQEIARSGMSGKTDTPKLHFEVRVNSNPVDPQQFLE